MYWYVIPMFQKPHRDVVVYVPGFGTPAAEYEVSSNFTIHAASPKNAPTSALLGLSTPVGSTPDSWVPKTVEAACAYFESVMGRAPSSREVF